MCDQHAVSAGDGGLPRLGSPPTKPHPCNSTQQYRLSRMCPRPPSATPPHKRRCGEAVPGDRLEEVLRPATTPSPCLCSMLLQAAGEDLGQRPPSRHSRRAWHQCTARCSTSHILPAQLPRLGLGHGSGCRPTCSWAATPGRAGPLPVCYSVRPQGAGSHSPPGVSFPQLVGQHETGLLTFSGQTLG